MLTTLDAARDMQRRHAKLLRDIDRLRSILPPDFAATAFIPDARIAPPYPPTGLRLRPSPDARTDAAGNRQRSSVLTRDILPFLFMGQATKHEIRWMAETVRRTT